MALKYLYVTAGQQVLARNKKEALYLFSVKKGDIVQWGKVLRVGYASRAYRDTLLVQGYGDLYSNKPIRADGQAMFYYALLRS